jgi:hypothetical protein
LVSPMSFGQQKSLVMTGLDGLTGIMAFIKNLNDVISTNTSDNNLKIYDRVPVVLALRKAISSKKIIKDEVEIDVDDLIKQFKPFDIKENETVEGVGFKVNLRVPTLTQEQKYLATCIEDLKKMDVDHLGKNMSLVLTYELPKFITDIVFGEKTITMDELSIGDRTKILNNLPATVTNGITEFILKVREYDEKMLTYNGVVVDIDSNFFE